MILRVMTIGSIVSLREAEQVKDKWKRSTREVEEKSKRSRRSRRKVVVQEPSQLLVLLILIFMIAMYDRYLQAIYTPGSGCNSPSAYTALKNE